MIAPTTYAAKLRTVTLTVRETAPQPVISNATMAVPILRAIFETIDADREHLVILALDTRNNARGFKIVATGAMDASQVDPRTIFRDALALGAAGFILAHNHPSGDPAPSQEDRAVTSRIAYGAALLGMPLLDHIIIGAGRHYSFGENFGLPARDAHRGDHATLYVLAAGDRT